MTQCLSPRGRVFTLALSVFIACSIFVFDDDMYEGRESMTIWLEAEEEGESEAEVLLSSNTSAVTVYIEDPEDGMYTCT